MVKSHFDVRTVQEATMAAVEKHTMSHVSLMLLLTPKLLIYLVVGPWVHLPLTLTASDGALSVVPHNLPSTNAHTHPLSHKRPPPHPPPPSTT
jgi:hypothetical protein